MIRRSTNACLGREEKGGRTSAACWCFGALLSVSGASAAGLGLPTGPAPPLCCSLSCSHPSRFTSCANHFFLPSASPLQTALPVAGATSEPSLRYEHTYKGRRVKFQDNFCWSTLVRSWCASHISCILQEPSKGHRHATWPAAAGCCNEELPSWARRPPSGPALNGAAARPC